MKPLFQLDLRLFWELGRFTKEEFLISWFVLFMPTEFEFTECCLSFKSCVAIVNALRLFSPLLEHLTRHLPKQWLTSLAIKGEMDKSRRNIMSAELEHVNAHLENG
ncbi:uncharacterized protein LOC127902569 isoform X3 [Citrus sinensis]|uniref:uncharacterized protein LOC18040517 isoform X2 n=1 Tax=Citrus clementina TaxID=85681 RepID=UPI000CED026F|nr:uncharacterized protein LOC18040517 isoform X2 [Citrus x clementina]XP_052298001.1 uncharacterized protein LOC127902569 isoform X3 [Citrus sinensis]